MLPCFIVEDTSFFSWSTVKAILHGSLATLSHPTTKRHWKEVAILRLALIVIFGLKDMQAGYVQQANAPGELLVKSASFLPVSSTGLLGAHRFDKCSVTGLVVDQRQRRKKHREIAKG